MLQQSNTPFNFDARYMMRAFTFVAKTFRQNFFLRFYKHYIIDSIIIVKKFGFKELVRKRGTKVLYIIIGYYAVRDTLIYIVIPYCVARGIFQNKK